jgi:ketosteroid isomerase-like protein
LNLTGKNKKLVFELCKAFSKGNKDFITQNLDDDVCWNIVGMPLINGKNDFINAMEMMKLESFPDIKTKNVIAEGDYVVVESSGILNTKTGKPYTPSYCDVYLIRNGKIQELTTYIVDITLNNES